MESTENQNITNYRSQLAERMKTRYPDRNYEGPDGTEGPDDLNQSALEAMDDYDSKMKEYDKNNESLVNLFKTSPKAATFLNTWRESGSPAIAFRKVFGKDAYESMQSEEGAKLIAEIEAEEQKRLAENESLAAEKDRNFQQSMQVLADFGKEKGLSDEELVKLFSGFYDILLDAEEGKYSREVFDMIYKSQNYDKDVEGARHEGEVAGRNANIKAQARKRQEASAMPPAMSGQGVREPETKPAVKDDPWMLG